MGDGDIRDFADASEESGCAKHLVSLTFGACGIGEEGMRVLADLLSRGIFPALKFLNLGQNPNISDVGILALSEGLLKSTQTCLETLFLNHVGLGDEGIAALASLVEQGVWSS